MPCYKMKEDKPLLIFSSHSWCTDVQGEEIKEIKRWENQNFGQKFHACYKRPLGNQGLTPQGA